MNGNDNFNWTSSYETAPSRQNSVWDYLVSMDPNVNNRFDNYENQFSYEDIAKNLNDLFGSAENNIQRNAAEDVGQTKQSVLSTLASKGLTSGSQLTDALGSASADVNKTKYNALGQLGTAKANSMGNLMETFNKLKLQTTEKAQNVDLANVSNLLSKAGLIGNYDQAWSASDLQNKKYGNTQPNTMDDIMNGVQAAMQIAQLIALL